MGTIATNCEKIVSSISLQEVVPFGPWYHQKKVSNSNSLGKVCRRSWSWVSGIASDPNFKYGYLRFYLELEAQQGVQNYRNRHIMSGEWGFQSAQSFSFRDILDFCCRGQYFWYENHILSYSTLVAGWSCAYTTRFRVLDNGRLFQTWSWTNNVLAAKIRR